MMSYKRVPMNKTLRYGENRGLIGKISGLNDAIYLRNIYQTELDNAHASIVNMVHYLESISKKLKGYYNVAPALKKNVEAHEKERHDLYASLLDLLNNETNFEKWMWAKTRDGHNVSTINIKQKFNHSDVDEMHYDSMLQYLKKYPEYASKPSYSKIYLKIQEKERGILNEKKRYHTTVSKINYELSIFQQNIQKAEDKFIAYNMIFNEGEQKLANCRYNNSIFYKFASDKTKAMVNLNTLSHRIDQFRNTLSVIKNELSDYKGEKLIEMEY